MYRLYTEVEVDRHHVDQSDCFISITALDMLYLLHMHLYLLIIFIYQGNTNQILIAVETMTFLSMFLSIIYEQATLFKTGTRTFANPTPCFQPSIVPIT